MSQKGIHFRKNKLDRPRQNFSKMPLKSNITIEHLNQDYLAILNFPNSSKLFFKNFSLNCGCHFDPTSFFSLPKDGLHFQ